MRVPSHLCLLGDVSDSYRKKLIDLVPASRRGELRFLPLTSPGDLPSAIAAYDIGLALEPETPESRYLTTTNKIFQYLNAGLAIVATPTAGQREVMSAIPACGIIVESKEPKVLAAQLDTLLSSSVRLGEMGAAARDGAANRYCWERTAPQLVAAVAAAIEGQTNP
jgi:glycosyltransferase involved in cell wall biosynthesis